MPLACVHSRISTRLARRFFIQRIPFFFSCATKHFTGFHRPSFTTKKSIVLIQPISDPHSLQIIQSGISEIQNRTSVTSLSGWIYYDLFLRFLHTIRPQKLSLIKSLKFAGIFQLHRCSKEVCKSKCDDDLMRNLYLYILIIIFLLSNLEKLTICAANDHFLSRYIHHTTAELSSIEERLTPLPEKKKSNYPEA
jgi:hypothetical protein